MYQFLDTFFVVFHSVLTLFNLVGWIWKPTRRLHLIVISLTMASWSLLGIFYGWGYCPFTDWHWQVKTALGEINLPTSYVKYYLDYVTGRSWEAFWVDIWVVGLGILVFLLSIAVNVRDWKQSKHRLDS